MRILLITETLIRYDNNVGNSYSNIFDGMKDIRMVNVCCQQGQSQNSISEKCYQISENLILKNILNKSNIAGMIEDKHTHRDINNNEKKRKMYNFARILRFQIFFWIRNTIWKMGRWKNGQLCKFVDDFKPDIIFAQLQDKVYLDDLIIFLKDYLKIPLVLYVWDDVYSLKQYSFSVLYWIDRLFQRSKIKKVVKRCDKLYTISYEQSKEYSSYFKKECDILYKGHNFNDKFIEKKVGKPIKIVYTGNLYADRWKSVAMICENLKKINQDGIRMQLFIYSATPLLKSQIDKLSIKDSSFFCGVVSADKVYQIQKDADMLLHAEAFTLKGSMTVRLSFSTKIVDYFVQQKCILAIGHSRCASINYLKRNDAAIVIDDKRHIMETLSNIANDSSIINKYAKKSWICGLKNHQISKIMDDLRNDLVKIAGLSDTYKGDA